MAKKKKRPRHPSSVSPQAPRGGANLERRDRKEEARRLREAERRRARRAASLRRTLTSAGIAVAAVAAIALFRSFQGPDDIPEAAVQAASEAGCTDPEHRPDLTPAQQPHLAQGETITYPDPPATSGKHNGSSPPDDPKVYDTAFDETLAVHALEHGAVFVYYLPEADGGLPQAVVDRLADIASESNATFLAPYPTLTPETALTLTAWNYRQSCPVSADGTALTPEAAATIVNGFVTGFECTGEAPENGISPC